MKKGPLIVLSGPSGSGKSTLIGRLLKESPWPLRLSVSVTTRPPRPRERPGVHYHFWSRDEFLAEVARDGFLEWADVFGNCYGTLKMEVEPYREQGQGVLLDIDVKGWEQVRQKCPDAVAIFLRASSMAVYEERLRRRGTESEASLQRRLKGAAAEEARIHEYHHQVVNDDLDQALNDLRALIEPLFERN